MSDTPFRIWQFLTGTEDTCNYYRMILPARYCRDELLTEGIDLQSRDIIPSDGDFDAFVWHSLFVNPPDRMIGNAYRWQRFNKLVNWSVDDDYRCLPWWNPVKITREQSNLADWSANHCNRINCSTSSLASVFAARPGVASVTPNLLELPSYAPFKQPDRQMLQICYAGTVTHLGDMEQLIEPITNVLNMYDHVEFCFIGTLHHEIKRRHWNIGVRFEHPRPMMDYWNLLAIKAPDIWLCPLADCEFNRSKSGLKAIEGMALEAAVIATDIEPYRDTITSGVNGLLVTENDEAGWTDALCTLIENTQTRLQMAQAGRETVEYGYNWHRAECREPWLDYYRQIRQDAKTLGLA